MDHEVFVPVAAETVREALRDPARVARCVQGLQRNADDVSAGPLSGRLKVRIGSHTITYRGALRIVERDGVFTVEGEGTEARGTGSVTLTLTIGTTESEGGTTLAFRGTARAEGRLAELPGASTEQTAHRLLDRFAERLAAVAAEEAPADGKPVAGAESSEEPERPESSEEPGKPRESGKPERDRASEVSGEAGGPAGPGPGEPDQAAAQADQSDQAGEPGEQDAVSGPSGADGEPPAPRTPSVFETPVPPPSLGADAEDEFDAFEQLDEEQRLNEFVDDGTDEDEDDDELVEFGDLPDGLPDEPPAEAAHARRTMIGRSAEEVDHAPPRGRYAPTPAPDSAAAGLPLRWIAPAAALAVASAVVVGRALRRRR
ncbi:SRPBCC domain-containing protein [Streptomyces sp. NPDC051018]|uniref:SRPBCC domain-containing protein n=1 Tax=Streptomyces sp. NPDC051018 TaxID=3365639 RepID=UPI0037A88737